MDIPKDILIEILGRLPQKYVFRVRCVSKRWNEVIKDMDFLRSYAQRGRKRSDSESDRLLGFVQATKRLRIAPLRCFEPPSVVLSLVGNLNGWGLGSISTPTGYVMSSSNGLILCCQRPWTYHVMNNLTKKSVSLPSPTTLYKYISMGLSCEENTAQLVPNYRVLRTGVNDFFEELNKLTIETYTSHTGKWIKSTLVPTEKFSLIVTDPPEVLNGIFHWVAASSLIAVYDPNDIGGENHLQLIQKPQKTQESVCSYVVSRSSDGSLWYTRNLGLHIEIWVLPKGENGYRRSCTIPMKEWNRVHEVTIHPPCNDFAIIKKSRASYSTFLISFCPPVVFLRIEQHIVSYDIKNKTTQLVHYHGRPTSVDYEDYIWYPYFEPSFLSSYAL